MPPSAGAITSLGPLGTLEHEGSERAPQRGGVLRVLQHERALEVATAVQTRGETEMPLQQSAGFLEELEDVFLRHTCSLGPLSIMLKTARTAEIQSNSIYVKIKASAAKRSVLMSGHSKWHSIKHKKAATDSKRGRIFTRLIKEMTVAARSGGGDLDANPRLRLVVNTAKAANMPAENIKRAIMRGTGELPGVSYEEINYEGYGPGGVAIFMRTLTDNRNRTVAELRHILSKNGGNLGEGGCVAWMFERKGYLVVEKAAASEEKLLDLVLGNGGDDMTEDGDNYEIFSAPEKFEALKAALEAAEHPPGCLRSLHGPPELHQARGQGGSNHAEAHGSSRGPGRHPERLVQLRH